MPPKKQIKPPSGFKVKLDPKDEAKKLKNLEEQNKAIIIKNLAVKKEREGLVDEEEEDRIRNSGIISQYYPNTFLCSGVG